MTFRRGRLGTVDYAPGLLGARSRSVFFNFSKNIFFQKFSSKKFFFKDIFCKKKFFFQNNFFQKKCFVSNNSIFNVFISKTFFSNESFFKKNKKTTSFKQKSFILMIMFKSRRIVKIEIARKRAAIEKSRAVIG